MSVPEIDVIELQRRRVAGEPHVVIDVREADELATASIGEVVHIPMQQIAQRISEIPAVPIVVMCHHGGRSERVASYLIRQGFADVVNLEGGIDAWSLRIDPTVPRY